MTPEQFIAKWRRSRGQEAAGAQEWFIDLCRVVGHGTPNELDPHAGMVHIRAFRFERRPGARDAQMSISAATSLGSSKDCTAT